MTATPEYSAPPFRLLYGAGPLLFGLMSDGRTYKKVAAHEPSIKSCDVRSRHSCGPPVASLAQYFGRSTVEFAYDYYKHAEAAVEQSIEKQLDDAAQTLNK